MPRGTPMATFHICKNRSPHIFEAMFSLDINKYSKGGNEEKINAI